MVTYLLSRKKKIIYPQQGNSQEETPALGKKKSDSGLSPQLHREVNRIAIILPTFSPSLNAGRPLYGQVLHRKASPSPHCKLY